MEFMLFTGIFLLAISIGMLINLQFKIKEDSTDIEKKDVKTNKLKVLASSITGIILIILYCINI